MQKSKGAAALRDPYLRIVHLEVSSPAAGGAGGANPFGAQFSPEEEEEFGEMARSDGFYERFARSVGPSIYGSLGLWLTLVGSFLTPLISSTNRYQKGHYLFVIRRVEENST